jgi:nitrite reductase/ring-hydroxylating ferredoxin subunit/uncharacterized membrane protein
MTKKVSDRLVAALPGLDPAARLVQKALAPVLGPSGNKWVQDALNGTWLGHPLHPAAVVLPVGFWASTSVLDLAGLEQGADLTLQLGLLSAVGAAASGAAQWQDTQEMVKPRRIGLLHASLNTGAAALYGTSWWLRARGSRKAGVGVALAGLTVASLSAWLGGELAYDLGIGVNRTAFEDTPADWVDVMEEAALQEQTPTRVEAGGVPVLLWRQSKDEIWAIDATCPHLGGPLHAGTVQEDTVTCPWHGSVFCLRDGALIHGPATTDAPAFDVRVQGGCIAVRARDQ